MIFFWFPNVGGGVKSVGTKSQVFPKICFEGSPISTALVAGTDVVCIIGTAVLILSTKLAQLITFELNYAVLSRL